MSKVLTGSSSNLILLIIEQPCGTDFILTWDVLNNQEIEAYEIGGDYEVIWDSNGYPYVVTDEKVSMTQQKCSITAYDYIGSIQSYKQNQAEFNF